MSKKSAMKVFCFTLLCLLCFAGQSFAAPKVILKFAGANPKASPAVISLYEKFKPMLEEMTNGKVEVQIFDNAQLGGERDVMEQLQSGVVQMSYLSPVIASLYPKINILDMPFLFVNDDHVDKVLDGPLGEEILKDLPAVGLIPLGYMENGFRVMTTSTRAIESINDMKGLKIRTPEAPLSVAIFNALGANPTPMSFTELYSALQQGVVDGQENSYNTWVSSRFFEVQKFAAETNHMWGCYVILASGVWWNRLDQDIKDAIIATSKETSKYQREVFRSQTADSKKKAMDGGMKVTTPDLADFRKALQPVYDNFYKQHPQFKDLVEQIRAMQ